MGQDFRDLGFVVGDQAAFGLAFLGAAEGVEGGVAEEFEFGEGAEGFEHPGAVALLEEVAGAFVAFGEDWGGEVEFQAGGGVELGGEGGFEVGGGVEAGDFVFVLVGDELGVVAGDGFGEGGGAGEHAGFGFADVLDELAVATGGAAVLEFGEVGFAGGDQVVEACGGAVGGVVGNAGGFGDAFEVDGGAAAPGEAADLLASTAVPLSSMARRRLSPVRGIRPFCQA